MHIREATKRYEDWMSGCTAIVTRELRDKHKKMKKDPFQFLRATYYRWAQLWPEACPESKRGPVVVSIGDVHIDSYGTWRDVEGRMCWGIDDFDESWLLPYTNDLIRLAASVKIARKIGILNVKFKRACQIILRAYARSLRAGGSPIVLAEEEAHLQKLGIGALKAPKSFWTKLKARPSIRGNLPTDAKKGLELTFPLPNLEYRVVRRQAGLGSLGQLRFVAIADCRGGCIAREVKNLVPSAHMWLNGRKSQHQSYYEKAIACALRSPDPYQKTVGRWLIRRLSPDSNPIKIEELAKERDEEVILHAMGTEVANVHLGDPRRTNIILKHLQSRERNWLQLDAKKMAKVFVLEWKEYKSKECKTETKSF